MIHQLNHYLLKYIKKGDRGKSCCTSCDGFTIATLLLAKSWILVH